MSAGVGKVRKKCFIWNRTVTVMEKIMTYRERFWRMWYWPIWQEWAHYELSVVGWGLVTTISIDHNISGKNKIGLHYAKRPLMSWVVVIPKEGWAHVAAPILLLVWHWLFGEKIANFIFSKKSVSYQKNVCRVWGFIRHTAMKKQAPSNWQPNGKSKQCSICAVES